MNDAIGVENLQAAQVKTLKKAEKLEGEQALRLIESAAQAPRVAADQLGRFPPPAPVSATPREGSTVHVVA
jgi:hypothetical protein